MDQISQFSSTTLGYLMAFVIPGASAIYAASFFASPLAAIIDKFNNSKADLGLFLLGLLAALAIGLFIDGVRAEIYEELWDAGHLNKNGFRNLSKGNVLMAFRAATDEHYRYHQFSGSISLIWPFLLAAFCDRHFSHLILIQQIVIVTCGAALEVILIKRARMDWKLYLERGNEVLGGHSIVGGQAQSSHPNNAQPEPEAGGK